MKAIGQSYCSWSDRRGYWDRLVTILLVIPTCDIGFLLESLQEATTYYIPLREVSYIRVFIFSPGHIYLVSVSFLA